jgi:hypothetical protein
VWVSFDNDPNLDEPQDNQLKCETCLEVERVLIHPDYDKRIDIGVIILKEPVDDALIPIKLPTLGLLDKLKRSNKLKNAEFLAVGYGATAIDPPNLATGTGESKVGFFVLTTLYANFGRCVYLHTMTNFLLL